MENTKFYFRLFTVTVTVTVNRAPIVQKSAEEN